VRPSAFPGTIGTDIATGDLAVAGLRQRL